MKIDGRLEMGDINALIRKRGLEAQGRVQQYIDKEVLRRCDPYVPFLTGTLKASGTSHTVIGSGQVKYSTPYARIQYFSNRGSGIEGTGNGGQRGRQWFERMKADHKEAILQGAIKFAGGVSK